MAETPWSSRARSNHFLAILRKMINESFKINLNYVNMFRREQGSNDRNKREKRKRKREGKREFVLHPGKQYHTATTG